MIRGTLFLGLSLLLVSGDVAAQSRRIRVSLRGYEHLIVLDTVAVWTELLASPAEAYGATRQVLDSLKMPLTHVDSAGGLLFNQGFIARGKLAGRRMSWVWRCGSGMTGDYADTWRISMAYAVFIDPTGTAGSRLGVALAASAQDIQGVDKPAIHCGTTGLLEREIAKLVALKLLR